MAILLKETKDFVAGDIGLAELLRCSRTTVWRMRKSGLLDPAMHRVRGKRIYDTAKVLEITKLY